MNAKAMPLLWLSSAFLLGVAIGTGLPLPLWVWGCVLLFALLVIWIERILKSNTLLICFRAVCPVPFGLLLVSLAFGASRAAVNQIITSTRVAELGTGSVENMQGEVAGMPEQIGARTRLLIDISEPIDSRVMIYVSRSDEWEYGDRLDITGVVIPIEPGNSLAWRGVEGVLYYPQVVYIESQPTGLMGTLYQIRQRAKDLLFIFCPQPEAGFLSGILLGMGDYLTDDLYEAFRQTGTSHILVISGFNMALVAGLVTMLLQRVLPVRKAAPITIVVVTLYTLLTGATPPVVRAAFMAVLSVLAATIGRRNTGINTLALTAAVMCLFNPLLLGNASFQLSFTATMGLVLFADPLQVWFTGWLEKRMEIGLARRVAAPVAEYFLFTIAAQIMSAPVLFYWFGRIPMVAFLANPLLLPVQPAVMVLSGLAVLAGLIWAPLGQVLAWLAWPLTAYTTHIVLLLDRLPAGWMQLENLTVWGVIGLYGLTGAAFYAWQHRWTWLKPTLALAFTGLAVAGLARSALAAPVGYLRITAWQGDTVLIQTPNGNSLLINGQGIDALEGQLLSRLGGQELTAVLITPDTASDLSMLAEIVTETSLDDAWWIGGVEQNSAGQYLQSELAESGVLPGVMRSGDFLQLDNGIRLEVLCITEDGAAYWLEYGGLSILIPGGLPRPYLTLPNHTPDLVIVSIDEMEDWQELPTLNPLLDGWSMAVSNGDELWLEEGR